MAVDMKTLSSIQSYQNSMKMEVASDKQAALKNRPDLPDNASPIAQMAVDKTFHSAKLQQNASVITHLFNQGSKQDIELFSMKVSYQSAIEAINEKLRIDLGLDSEAADPVSQQKLEEQGGMEYWSSENTAKRIVDGATGFLSGFQNAHPELEGEALMDKFMDVVGGGLIQGFEQAKGFLGDLNVFEDTVEENYNATFDLVQKGMEQFRKDFLGIVDEAPATDSEKAE
ncbi:DUF5610 domain-containing protein [Thiomicrorhabdus indica]|uniref:DUF5610 domain-containing protein n=1 Tax=Thiomicrorhabdus indica TaxID=2267253 RepID=UPI00102DCE1F|nr:DUF5610 domain-containing protein [Thiomicrorhabdus indica]